MSRNYGLPPIVLDQAVVSLDSNPSAIGKDELQTWTHHSKWDWDYVLSELQPDIFLISTRGLIDREAFVRDYLIAKSQSGQQFFVRRSAAHRLLDPTISLLPLPVGPR